MLFMVLRISSGMGGGLDTMLIMVLRISSGGRDALYETMLFMVLRISSGMGGGLDIMLGMVQSEFLLEGGMLYKPCYSWFSEFLLEWVEDLIPC